MNRTRWTLASLIVALLGLQLVWVAPSIAKEEGKEKPKAAERVAKPKQVFAPYNKLELTDDQKTKIMGIHDEIAAKIAELRKSEDDQINAVLTDAQKAQLEEMKKAEHEKMMQRKAEQMKEKGEKKAEEKTPAKAQ